MAAAFPLCSADESGHAQSPLQLKVPFRVNEKHELKYQNVSSEDEFVLDYRSEVKAKISFEKNIKLQYDFVEDPTTILSYSSDYGSS